MLPENGNPWSTSPPVGLIESTTGALNPGNSVPYVVNPLNGPPVRSKSSGRNLGSSSDYFGG